MTKLALLELKRIRTLSEGDTVTIYKDPKTQKQAEGKAQLVQLLEDSQDTADDTLELWSVCFVGLGAAPCERRILTKAWMTKPIN